MAQTNAEVGGPQIECVDLTAGEPEAGAELDAVTDADDLMHFLQHPVSPHATGHTLRPANPVHHREGGQANGTGAHPHAALSRLSHILSDIERGSNAS